jgi:hypothetical protein
MVAITGFKPISPVRASHDHTKSPTSISSIFLYPPFAAIGVPAGKHALKSHCTMATKIIEL